MGSRTIHWPEDSQSRLGDISSATKTIRNIRNGIQQMDTVLSNEPNS